MCLSSIKRKTRQNNGKFTVNLKSNMGDSVKCYQKVSGSSLIVSPLPRIAGLSRSVRGSSHIGIILINDKVSGTCTKSRNAITVRFHRSHDHILPDLRVFRADNKDFSGCWNLTVCRSFLALTLRRNSLFFSLSLIHTTEGGTSSITSYVISFYSSRACHHFCPFWPQTPRFTCFLVSTCQKFTLGVRPSLAWANTEIDRIESRILTPLPKLSERGNPPEEQPDKCMKQSLFFILHICT